MDEDLPRAGGRQPERHRFLRQTGGRASGCRDCPPPDGLSSRGTSLACPRGRIRAQGGGGPPARAGDAPHAQARGQGQEVVHDQSSLPSTRSRATARRNTRPRTSSIFEGCSTAPIISSWRTRSSPTPARLSCRAAWPGLPTTTWTSSRRTLPGAGMLRRLPSWMTWPMASCFSRCVPAAIPSASLTGWAAFSRAASRRTWPASRAAEAYVGINYYRRNRYRYSFFTPFLHAVERFEPSAPHTAMGDEIHPPGHLPGFDAAEERAWQSSVHDHGKRTAHSGRSRS